MTFTHLAILETFWVIGLGAWIILERRSPAATLAWVFALAWLPVVGIVVYLAIGPRRLSRKRRRHAAARLRVRDASAARRKSWEGATDGPAADPRIVQLAHLVQRAGEAPPLRSSRLEVFASGDECYASIEQAVAAARHHVHLEYYIWEPDRTGTRFRDLLCQKAREGVEVRLLVDAVGSSGLGRKFLAPLRESGAEVAWFNPISLARLRPGLFNFRSHRKIVVCDGRVGFTGGMNLCDHHSAAASGPRAWRDTHLRLEGLPVGWLQTVFLEDWHVAAGGPSPHPVYFPDEPPPAAGPWVQIVASGPDREIYAIHDFYFSAIAAARERVWVTTAYFVPDEAIYHALVTAALRGLDVRVLAPGTSDVWLAAVAGRSYYEDLLGVGVRIFEYTPSMLHAKTLVVDQDISVVGTPNVDNRSFRLNFEVMAAIYDHPTTQLLAKQFECDLRHAKEYTARRARRTALPRRLIESTARLLAPLL